MSFVNDYPRMKALEDLYGNKFEALLQVSNSARLEVDKSYHILNGSQALSYLLGGTLPSKIGKISKSNNFKYADYLIKQIEDDLSDIYDEQLRSAVHDSLYKSFENGYLIYEYKDIEIPQKKRRVRILCNMLWDKVIK